MAQQLNIRDVVQLKSGGPSMTIEVFDHDTQTVLCSWFDDEPAGGKKKELKTGRFSPDALRKLR